MFHRQCYAKLITIIKANQKEYYNAIAISDKQGKSTEFIAFMLRCLYDSLKQYQMEKVADKVTYKVADKKLNPTEEKILKLIDSNPYMTINDICVNLNMSDSGVRKNLAALRAKCVIKRIGANKNGHWEIIK
jgi:predicted HTH transcriptional regulator